MIATNGLDAINNRASYELKKLLQTGDASDAGYWTHEVESKMGILGSLHFQGQADNAVCKADHCPDGRCISNAIRAFYAQLVGDDTSKYAGLLPPKLTLTDSDAVKFLITLIGDMHQPMHVSRISDDFGRRSNTILGGRANNMFEVWESGLITQETKNSAWWSGWTQIANAPTFAADRKAFDEKGLAVIDDWIDENAKYACNSIFARYSTVNNLNNIPAIDMNLNALWRQEVRARLLMAGSRTAVIIHGLLAERARRGQTKFRGGSAFAPIAEPEMLEAAITSQSGAAFLNLCVLATVLLAFVLFVRRINDTTHIKE